PRCRLGPEACVASSITGSAPPPPGVSGAASGMTCQEGKMARKKVSRNAPCPCGSGKKYKHCCYGKRFDYEEDDDGTIFKSIPMSQEMVDLLEEQRQKFVQKYGREPGPNDPVFFDMPHPEQVEHLTVQAMKQAGIDPALIYACEQTGRPLT